MPTWSEFIEDYRSHYFDDSAPQAGRCFLIEWKGEQIGQINYNEIHRDTGWVELDIWMKDSRYTRQGFGTDALRMLCDYLGKTFACSKFMLAPSARNRLAIRAYEKAGFYITKEVPPFFAPDYADAVVMVREI